mgnify:CR=1 FL=1
MASQVPQSEIARSDWWNFEQEGQEDLYRDLWSSPTVWSYELDGVALPQVPLPASAPLLLGGIAALAWVKRRKRG